MTAAHATVWKWWQEPLLTTPRTLSEYHAVRLTSAAIFAVQDRRDAPEGTRSARASRLADMPRSASSRFRMPPG